MQDLLSHRLLPFDLAPLWPPELLDPLLLELHMVSDLLIALSYGMISAALIVFFVRARRDLPFGWIYPAFGLFIVACGGVHFMHVVLTLGMPALTLAIGIQGLTLVASLATAVALPPAIPRMLALVRAAKVSQERKRQLEEAHDELTQLYARLKEHDELKTHFFASVSHELRTPLTLILGPTRRLLRDDGLPEDARRELEVVERNAQTLLRHVNDLLDVARLDAGHLGVTYAKVDLAQVVRLTAGQFDVLAQERGIAYSVETPSLAAAEVDVAKLQRVLMNLLANAFKFTPDGGAVRCALTVDERSATLIVRDSGPGVPVALRAAIFERFRQGEGGANRRFGGTGLGLAIVKQFVELHGGTVAVDAAPGGGARFTVVLPARAPAGARVDAAADALQDDPEWAEPMADQMVRELPARREPALSAAPPADGRPLVLVVEDQPDMRRFIAETLAPRYRVATAQDGAEGLTRATELQPDLILTDVMMPHVSGDELLRALRQRPDLDGIPIVLLTAKADDALRVQMLREGAQDCLVKPFSAEELEARVSNLMMVKLTRDLLQREVQSQGRDLTALANELTIRTRELRRALDAREDFLSSAAHHLKTPLAALLLQAQMLERRVSRDATAPADLPRVRAVISEAVRLRDLIVELLDASRADRGQLVTTRERTDLAELAKEVCRNTHTERHRLVLALDGPAVGEYDRSRVKQLLANLLDNAMKYSPLGGNIQVKVWQDGSQAHMVVADQGIGIVAADLPHIFERFQRGTNVDDRRFAGLGLGLFLCRAIVEEHGGQISATSPGPHAGSEIHVVLPVVPTAIAGVRRA